MNPRWLVAVVAALVLFFLGLGLAFPGQVRAIPTFTFRIVSVENGKALVEFTAVPAPGDRAAFDPESVVTQKLRLASIEGGKWVWRPLTPILEGAEPQPDKLIESFKVEPATIRKGESAKLAWSCPKAKSVTINAVAVPVTGSQTVSPPATATYTLTAQAEGLPTQTAQRILTVSDLPPPELWGIVVEESSQRTTAQAAIITSTEIRDLLGGNLRVVDKDSDVSADLKPYVDRAKTGKLPQFFLVDKAGTVFFEGNLPADKAATIALIRKFKPGDSQ